MKSLSIKTFVCAMSLLAAGTTFAGTTELKAVFAPQNDLHIPVGAMSKAGSGIDEATYNTIVDRVQNYFAPIVAARGGKLTINKMWSDDTVNSQARRSGKNWYVDAFGGLARYPLMTADAEMMVLCHEMGHHLGGFPKGKGIFGSSWASNEGQADYFATMKGFRLLTAADDNVTALGSAVVPKEVTAGCSATFKSAGEIALCARESLTANILADILYQLGRGSKSPATARDGEPATPPSFSTPSAAVVKVTNDDHPLAQCRLDTYFNGSICSADPSEAFGQKDAITGACSQEKGDTYGYRPTCWYKPGKIN